MMPSTDLSTAQYSGTSKLVCQTYSLKQNSVVKSPFALLGCLVSRIRLVNRVLDDFVLCKVILRKDWQKKVNGMVFGLHGLRVTSWITVWRYTDRVAVDC